MNFLTQALIYLGAAVVCVPFAKRLGMGSVLGYLLAGMIIGPFALGLIGKEGEDIMHFAEFGVVMMLFLIGLELEPSQFWKMRRSIVGMGSMQMVLSSLFIFLMMMVLGLTPQVSLAVALAFAMSSTAIVLQTIRERNRQRRIVILQAGSENSDSNKMDEFDMWVLWVYHLFPGNNSGGETPVPIPNTAVKPSCADGTDRASGRESRYCQDFLFSFC